ncbi:WhiB family transcriptional regulator [Streptomyces sp. NPDC001068]|uniref:WhiB family transcriptional regulator n=1 Tax=Streptomyces sp. NPDC001068 TaxID=3364544 RepID=UPI0036768133
MTQNADGKPTPGIVIPLAADVSVPFPEMTGDEPCRQDPDFWFPEQGVNAGPPKLFCNTCPVLIECRAWALANPELTVFGVWGGMGRSERNAVRRNAMKQSA